MTAGSYGRLAAVLINLLALAVVTLVDMNRGTRLIIQVMILGVGFATYYLGTRAATAPGEPTPQSVTR